MKHPEHVAGQNGAAYVLTKDEVDKVRGGMDWTGVGASVIRAIINKNLGDLVLMGHVVICDEGELCKVH